ncbi:hypothetical protein COO60DRAFT_477919 [Scenedesmus sp. NREL 46B-D3]|nr:hypothetical protein COO60DRAFT_477919 [Scenedesmus sp. NREL 46B-D3]
MVVFLGHILFVACLLISACHLCIVTCVLTCVDVLGVEITAKHIFLSEIWYLSAVCCSARVRQATHANGKGCTTRHVGFTASTPPLSVAVVLQVGVMVAPSTRDPLLTIGVQPTRGLHASATAPAA